MPALIVQFMKQPNYSNVLYIYLNWRNVVTG